MSNNSLQLVLDLMRCLSAAGIQTWLFGGWAEELHGLCPPRSHNDIDLLFPAEDFSLLGTFIRTGDPQIEEISAKRFSHKRAFTYSGVMVEILLLRPTAGGYTTPFFDLYRFEWPANTLSYQAPPGMPVPIASPDALARYREEHAHVDDARRRHLLKCSNPD